MSDKFCAYVTVQGTRCHNQARINGLCSRHSPRYQCIHLSEEGVQCSLLARKDGFCRHHAPEVRRICNYSNEGTQCSRRHDPIRRRRHADLLCIHIEEGVQCSNRAIRGGLCACHAGLTL